MAAGFGRRGSGTASVGIVGDVNVGTPPATSPASSSITIVEKDSAATWAVIWFVGAVVLLYFVLPG